MDYKLSSSNPVQTLEEFFISNNWTFDRPEENMIQMVTAGSWSDYRLGFSWRADLKMLFFSCELEIEVPASDRQRIAQVLMETNSRMGMGHFELCEETNLPVYRHSIPTHGLDELPLDQLEFLIDVALSECERFYPAFCGTGDASMTRGLVAVEPGHA